MASHGNGSVSQYDHHWFPRIIQEIFPDLVSEFECANYPYLQLRIKLNCEERNST